MKRRNWITAGIVCVLISGTAGTFALYQDTTAVQNHIRTGDISIGIQEYEEKNGAEVIYTGSEGRTVLPSQSVSKIPRITNYAQPCYLRVKIQTSGETPGEETVQIQGMPEGWVYAGEHYYWTQPLKTGESVDAFQRITIPSGWTEDESDKTFGITVTAEAVQSDHFFPDFQADQPWGDLETEICVHERDGAVTEVEKRYQSMSVTYEGPARNLVAVPEDFFENLGAAMPGDSLSDTVTLRNTTETEAEFFFRTEIPEELTEAQRDLMEQFELEITQEGRLLYAGDLGTEPTGTEPVSLGVYRPGEEGSIHFTLKLPAELNNAYARRETFVNWIFSVQGQEEPATEQEPGPAITQLSAPKTGVTDPYVAVPLLLAGVAGISTWLLERGERDHMKCSMKRKNSPPKRRMQLRNIRSFRR